MKYPNISAYKQAVVEQESFDKLQNVSIATQNGDLHYASGNFATVFKAAQNGNYYALKCFLTDQVDRAERYPIALKFFQRPLTGVKNIIYSLS